MICSILFNLAEKVTLKNHNFTVFYKQRLCFILFNLPYRKQL